MDLALGSQGCVIRTSDESYWYGAGLWAINGVTSTVPCLLAYIPEDRQPKGFVPKKRIFIRQRPFVKVFGHYGMPIEEYRRLLLASRKNILATDEYLGRLAFVKQDKIVEVRDPRRFLREFTASVPEAHLVFRGLSRQTNISSRNMGLSGSTLVLNRFRWRHESDLVIYGRANSRRFTRLTRTQSEKQPAPGDPKKLFHSQFQTRGRWVDPLCAELPEKRHYLDQASIRCTGTVENVTALITCDDRGMMFPSVYELDNRIRLYSFRIAHRGLFRSGQRVRFSALSMIEIRLRNSSSELAYAILNDEWATPLE